MSDILCPTCHSKISPSGSRTQGANGTDIDGNPVPYWSNDPIMTTDSINGDAYAGQQFIKAIDIIEIQNLRRSQEIQSGVLPLTEFTTVQPNASLIDLASIVELRISTERLLDVSHTTLQDYFRKDITGNNQPAGPKDVQDKTDWTDVNRGSTFDSKGKNASILLDNNTKFTSGLVIKNTPSFNPDTTFLRAIHIEDLRHPVRTLVPSEWEEDWQGIQSNNIENFTFEEPMAFTDILSPIAHDYPFSYIFNSRDVITNKHTWHIDPIIINGSMHIVYSDYSTYGFISDNISSVGVSLFTQPTNFVFNFVMLSGRIKNNGIGNSITAQINGKVSHVFSKTYIITPNTRITTPISLVLKMKHKLETGELVPSADIIITPSTQPEEILIGNDSHDILYAIEKPITFSETATVQPPFFEAYPLGYTHFLAPPAGRYYIVLQDTAYGTDAILQGGDDLPFFLWTFEGRNNSIIGDGHYFPFYKLSVIGSSLYYEAIPPYQRGDREAKQEYDLFYDSYTSTHYYSQKLKITNLLSPPT